MTTLRRVAVVTALPGALALQWPPGWQPTATNIWLVGGGCPLGNRAQAAPCQVDSTIGRQAIKVASMVVEHTRESLGW